MSLSQEPQKPQSTSASDDPGRVPAWRNLPRRSRGLSLRTLVILRWMAIFGQSATIGTATLYFHFDLPLWGCLAAIAASVVMNLNATARLNRSDGSLPDGRQTAAHLGFDILQLSILLGLTGGLQNPFCLLLVAPATVAAASLPGRQAALMGLMVLAATVSLFFIALPLPWQAGTELNLPPLYKFGIGMALVTGVIFTSAYAWRVAADAEKLELALATTQDVLQREQRLAAQIAASVAAAAPGRKGRKAAKAGPVPETIAPSQGGMGLGFFIARTLLERTGGKVFVGPGDGGQTPAKGQPKGARVAVRWSRPALEVPS